MCETTQIELKMPERNGFPLYFVYRLVHVRISVNDESNGKLNCQRESSAMAQLTDAVIQLNDSSCGIKSEATSSDSFASVLAL